MIFDDILEGVYSVRDYPALFSYMEKWSCTKPFDGLRVLVATPIFRNTLTEYRALIAGGAILSAGYSPAEDSSRASMPCDKKIVRYLQDRGIPVLTPSDVREQESKGMFFDLILDCAGQFSACHPRYGFVELTRSGVQFFEHSEKPVYVADSGIVKRIETSLGTGEGYFRALEQLNIFAAKCRSGEPEESCFDGKRLLVFGSGKVGSGIALQGVQRNCIVSCVTDTGRKNCPTDFSRMLESNGVEIADCNDLAMVTKLIGEADLVVTATGVKNALDKPEIVNALLNGRAVLANMGVEDEYGENIPPMRVLNGKSPLNFMLEEPTHLKYIEASMALHAALGELLLHSEQNSDGPMDPPVDLEQHILMITFQNGKIAPELSAMFGFPSDMEG